MSTRRGVQVKFVPMVTTGNALGGMTFAGTAVALASDLR